MDYLSGASPLNMTMKLGEYVMLVQLRLDQVDPPPSEKISSNNSDQSVCDQTTSGHEPHQSSRSEQSVLSQQGEVGGCDPRPHTVEEEKRPLPKRQKLDPKALTAASRDLIQTLQRIISQVRDLPPSSLARKDEESQLRKDERVGPRPSEEVQQPMLGPLKNHGSGIYGGTFEGPLGSAVLDQGGLPVNNTGTIVHILRDLLTCAFKSFGEGRDGGADKPKTTAMEPGAQLVDKVAIKLFEEEKEATRDKVENLRRQIAEKRARRKERKVKSL